MPKMQNQKPFEVKILQWVNLAVFFLSVGSILAMHNLPEVTLEILRVPKFLREIDPFLGFAWPSSLFIYQITLIFFLSILFLTA